MSHGGYECNTYGGTLAEILYAVLLDLCGYISEGVLLTFNKSSIDKISTTTKGIRNDSSRQSERDLTDLGYFRK